MNKRGTPRNLRPFKKGDPGGPGRPRELWRAWLSSVEPHAREVIMKILKDKRLKPETRLRAAEGALDRLHGRPKQEIEGLFGSEGIVVIQRDKRKDY